MSICTVLLASGCNLETDMKKLLTYVLCLSIVFLPACDMMRLTPEQTIAAKEDLHRQRAAGTITQAQHDAAIEALDNPKSSLAGWVDMALNAALYVLLGVPVTAPIASAIVNRKRGPVATPAERAARAAAGSK